MSDISPQIMTPRQAREAGLIRYWTGRPCKHGHIDWRQVVNSMCATCHRIKQAARPEQSRIATAKWRSGDPERARALRQKSRAANRQEELAKERGRYAANPEKYRAKAVAWAAANPDKTRACYTAYRSANREKVLAGYIAYRVANPEKVRATKAAHRDRNREKIASYEAAYRAKNPEKIRVNVSNRWARKKGAEGRYTEAEVVDLLKRQKSKCAYARHHLPWCNGRITLDTCHRDHIVPLSNPTSTNWIRNIQLTCQPCNNRKHAKDPVVFAQQIGLLI